MQFTVSLNEPKNLFRIYGYGRDESQELAFENRIEQKPQTRHQSCSDQRWLKYKLFKTKISSF